MKVRELLSEAVVIWYHGSNTVIETFDYTAREDATNQEGPGIYLTSSPNDAKMYGKHIHVVQAKIFKSRMMPEKRTLQRHFVQFLISKSPDADDVLTNWGSDRQSALRAAVDAIMDRHGPNEYREAMESIWYDYYRGYEREWLQRMCGAGVGWDGFIVDRSEGLKHFICFNPKILKVLEVKS